MRSILNRSRTAIATAILCTFALTLIFLSASPLRRAHAQQASRAAATGKQPFKTYTMYAGLWRTDGGFASAIRVKNVLVVAPMDVTPVLFMADGTPYPLRSVHLAVSGVATININDALANAPPSVASHISQFGSAALIHTYSSPGHVSASMAVIDVSRSLSYTFPFVESMGDSMQHTLDGLWWKHDPGVTGWIALSNVSDAEKQASVQLVGHGEEAQTERAISLAAHTTQMLHLEDFASNPSPLVKNAGGIRITYTGQPGTVLATGGLENDTNGYSANIPFWGHDMSSAPSTMITYASAGLMLGKPDPMMMPGFPKDTTFSPYLALRNTTEKPLDVALQVNYMTGMGAQGSMPVTKTLPAQHLAPFEAKHLDLQGPLAAAGLKNFNGSINLSISFIGKGGDLVFASGSVDQTGTYVFEVEPQGVGSSRSKYTNYWGVANGNDTMYNLWNPTDTAQDIAATFYYGDGSGKYTLSLHLAPQASTMIDMAMLIMQKKPDANGNLIPSSIQEGSADFSSAKDRREMFTLVIASGLYNVATATCGGGCIQCCGVTVTPGSNPQVYPNPFSCAVGGSVTLSGSAEDCQGYYYAPDNNGWTSNNPSVATVDSSGSVTCVSEGSVNISATWSNMVATTGQVCGAPSCPTFNPGAGSSGNLFSGVLTPQDNFSGRSTTRFGIAEVINLSYIAPVAAVELGGLQWSIVSGGGSLSNAGTDGTATYTAPGSSATVVLRLAIVSGASQGQKKDYTITIVTPSGGLLSRSSNIRHTQGYISVGFQGHAFLEPTDVSFIYLQFAEGSVAAVASGYFADLNGAVHPASSHPLNIGSCDSVLGCQVIATDTVDTNDNPPPFSAGDFVWSIPWQYLAPGGALTTFTTANHHQTADATGTATISKAGAGPFSKNASDPTTSY